MDAETKAALERTRGHLAYFVDGTDDPYQNCDRQYYIDLCRLRDLVLAEHPTDDDEQLTAEWVEAFDAAFKIRWDVWQKCFCLRDTYYPAICTRGQLRRLVAALKGE